MLKLTMSTTILVAAVTGLGCSGALAHRTFDIVIANGRVMDPESGLDAVRNVGIADGKVLLVSDETLSGKQVLDATGMVVAPGFIDLHAHGQDALSYALKAQDGVTTVLELEIGTADIDHFYGQRTGKATVNFGASISHAHTRMAVMGDPPAFLPPGSSLANTKEASVTEIAEIRRRIEHGLERGAPAVGFGVQYTGAASRFELIEAFRAAAVVGASCHVHVRYNGAVEPTSSTAAIEEVIAAAAISGASLHTVHIQSTSGGLTSRHLKLIADARTHGINVTTESYPYTFGMTNVASGVFDVGWQEQMGITYSDLQLASTGESLTAETFAKYHKEGALVAEHSMKPETVLAALTDPTVILASDSLLENGKGHPRSSGTYARVLGKYVREDKALTLMTALGKMTILPARVLERRTPMMRDKGRIRAGADADITVFDPDRVIDRATLSDAIKPSEGMKHVLVGGVPVVRDGVLQAGVFPGRGILAPIK